MYLGYGPWHCVACGDAQSFCSSRIAPKLHFKSYRRGPTARIHCQHFRSGVISHPARNNKPQTDLVTLFVVHAGDLIVYIITFSYCHILLKTSISTCQTGTTKRELAVDFSALFHHPIVNFLLSQFIFGKANNKYFPEYDCGQFKIGNNRSL